MLVGGLFLILTVLLYLGSKAVYKRHPKVYVSPLLVTPLVLVVLLLIVNIPYDAYNQGGNGSRICCNLRLLLLPFLYISIFIS